MSWYQFFDRVMDAYEEHLKTGDYAKLGMDVQDIVREYEKKEVIEDENKPQCLGHLAPQ